MGINMSKSPIPKNGVNHGKDPDRLTPKQFRDRVWKRDGSRDRATGELLRKSSYHWTTQGQVCHLQTRNPHADRATDPDNGILLSGWHHWLSDHRGGRLLRLTDPSTGEPATDASKPIRFTLRNTAGKILWTRIR